MSTPGAFVISAGSLIIGIFSVYCSFKRNTRKDAQAERAELTTVIVKLENIGIGITEIKNEMLNLKNDVQFNREKLIRLEEKIKHAHRRIDFLGKSSCEKAEAERNHD